MLAVSFGAPAAPPSAFAAAGFGAAFVAVAAAGFAAAGLGAAGFAAAAPGLALAAAKISAMLMPLPPGATFPPAGALAAAAGGADVSAAVSAGASAAAAAGAGAAPPPLAFSALAAARISSTDIFLAIYPRPCSRFRRPS